MEEKEQAYEYNENWKMFSTPRNEVMNLLVSLGEVTIGEDFLKIENYPFEPSAVYNQPTIRVEDIDDIDIQSYPPNIRIKNELIYIPADKKNALKLFAHKHHIPTVERPRIWEWILEPFLDTEYTTQTDQQISGLLEEFGLTPEKVKTIRAEVETQMLKYNFDTMLWEWVILNDSDVLKAMRTKYSIEEFRHFYRKVMDIALLSK